MEEAVVHEDEWGKIRFFLCIVFQFSFFLLSYLLFRQSAFSFKKLLFEILSIHVDWILSFSLTGIELVSETTEEELKQAQGDMPVLTQGVTVAYTKPAPKQVYWAFLYFIKSSIFASQVSNLLSLSLSLSLSWLI